MNSSEKWQNPLKILPEKWTFVELSLLTAFPGGFGVHHLAWEKLGPLQNRKTPPGGRAFKIGQKYTKNTENRDFAVCAAEYFCMYVLGYFEGCCVFLSCRLVKSFPMSFRTHSLKVAGVFGKIFRWSPLVPGNNGFTKTLFSQMIPGFSDQGQVFVKPVFGSTHSTAFLG